MPVGRAPCGLAMHRGRGESVPHHATTLRIQNRVIDVNHFCRLRDGLGPSGELAEPGATEIQTPSRPSPACPACRQKSGRAAVQLASLNNDNYFGRPVDRTTMFRIVQMG